jgi:hypothetical protein
LPSSPPDGGIGGLLGEPGDFRRTADEADSGLVSVSCRATGAIPRVRVSIGPAAVEDPEQRCCAVDDTPAVEPEG